MKYPSQRDWKEQEKKFYLQILRKNRRNIHYTVQGSKEIWIRRDQKEYGLEGIGGNNKPRGGKELEKIPFPQGLKGIEGNKQATGNKKNRRKYPGNKALKEQKGIPRTLGQ